MNNSLNESTTIETATESTKTQSNGVNVKVVVRCRPTNEDERGQGTCVGDFTSRSLTITKPKNPPKTYHFDHVFSTGTTQSEFFDVAAKPIVDEVLAGYNCTIFAYGQTSTGKTYTMEGIKGTDASVVDVRAGIVPRSIHHIFSTLENNNAEYSVNVTCLELYNEELQDLLATEKKQLRIFDESSGRKGTKVSGLEEATVTNANQILTILDTAQKKRQNAETNMNKNSSRSHVVTSIVIHMKETTQEGEELMRIGKLNLVDLAGSENIGRSGAQNKRAKEAGVINQSLLTLGRVIKALTDHSTHVPYRESKLTRLLQDSLGGRTRTCIIATISPSIINFEETMSTLDYSYRAKNIRNKPELNMKISRTAMIRELNVEIDKLKTELNNQRAKNGVFMSPEQYAELNATIESLRQQCVDTKAESRCNREDLENVTTQLRSSEKREQETNLKLEEETKTRLQVESKLSVTEHNLQHTLSELAEERHIGEELIKSRAELEVQAHGYVDDIKMNNLDIEGYTAKIERKNRVENENVHSVHDFHSAIDQTVDNTTANLQVLHEETTTGLKNINTTLFNFVQTKNKRIEGIVTQLGNITNVYGQDVESTKSLLDASTNLTFNILDTSSKLSTDHVTDISTAVDSHKEVLTAALKMAIDEFKNSQKELSAFASKVASNLSSTRLTVEKSMFTVADLHDQIDSLITSHCESQIQNTNVLHEQINVLIQDQLTLSNDLKEQVFSMIDERTNLMKRNLNQTNSQLSVTKDQQIGFVNRFKTRAIDQSHKVRTCAQETRNQVQSDTDLHLEQTNTHMESCQGLLRNGIIKLESTSNEVIQKLDQVKNVTVGYKNKIEQLHTTHTNEATNLNISSKNDLTSRLCSINSSQQSISQDLISFDQLVVDNFTNDTLEKSNALSKLSSDRHINLQQLHMHMKQQTNQFVDNYQIDRSCGTTPKKRKRECLDVCVLKTRDEIRNEYRSTNGAIVDETFTDKENVANPLSLDLCNLVPRSPKSLSCRTPTSVSSITSSDSVFSVGTPTKKTHVSTPTSAAKKKRRIGTGAGGLANSMVVGSTNSTTNTRLKRTNSVNSVAAFR
ncbi:kinesin family member [Acrasis kona]|uniref:Kinesin family member n=1 Tax=Acrasis kona TaxID=1008807 RepID=A0AAW2YKJ5_9EUKA